MLPLVAGLVVSSLNKHGESNAAQPRNSGLGGLLKGLFGKKNDHQQQAKAASHLCWILTATAMLQVMYSLNVDRGVTFKRKNVLQKYCRPSDNTGTCQVM